MFLTTLGSFLRDALKLMKDEQGFMKMDESARRTAIQKHLGDYPRAFVDYLATVKEATFLEQVHGSINFMNDGFLPENKQLLEALADYAAKEFATKLDLFDRSFFFESEEKQLAMLKEVFPGGSFFRKAMRDYVLGSTYQEISEEAQKFLRDFKEEPTIIVQSSQEIDKGIRQEVRAHFAKKHPYSFLEFQINPQIIGGLRVFIDGKVMDHSWLSKIQKISQLAYQLS
ncbi:MAG: F0F1 ATP synthase subunit delta [Candidatus Gracilibacteria bacterium]